MIAQGAMEMVAMADCDQRLRQLTHDRQILAPAGRVRDSPQSLHHVVYMYYPVRTMYTLK